MTRVSYQPDYEELLTRSKIVFEGKKCKVFSLAKRTGLQFTDILRKQITEVSSEFRLLPQNVGDSNILESKMLSLVTGSGEPTDNFRKIDNLRLRKSDFSGLLAEMEFYVQTLQIKEWHKLRKEFFTLCNQYVMALPDFFNFSDKLPKIISLATMCGNFMQISKILGSLQRIFRKISTSSICTISHPDGYRDPELQETVGKFVRLGRTQLKDCWLMPLCADIRTTIVSSFAALDDNTSNAAYIQSYEKRRRTISSRLEKQSLPRSGNIVRQVQEYLLHDLAHTRFIDHLYQKSVRPNSTHSHMEPCDILYHCGYDFLFQKSSLFDNGLVESSLALSRFCRGFHGDKWVPFALLFPTRPVREEDLFWFESPNQTVADGNALISPYRGYRPNLPSYNETPNKHTPSLRLENVTFINPKVALVSLRTEEYEALTVFRRSSKYQPLKRLNSIIKIVNSILSEKERINYILFHELSIPHKWFLPIAKKCASSGVSIIAGVDYILNSSGQCSNQVWMSLATRPAKGFPTVYYHFEDKAVLAYSELEFLKKEMKRYKQAFVAQPNTSKLKHGIIVHGKFAFSTLICSEITDIRNRERLRGLIDALFILAWNQDHSSFSPIIESAALDLHSYIVQCNNNKYGDSRVRMPGKEPWNRDTVRIRGGEDPYYVTVTLNIDDLREFQSTFTEPKQTDKFKPLPQGFRDVMAEYRKVEAKKK